MAPVIRINSVLSEVTETDLGVTPAREVSPEVYCRKLERGESLYVDSNHLSATGAQVLRSAFEDFLDSQGFR